MSRFLLAVWSLESHVNPNLAVGSALRKAGHEVAFYAGPKATPEIGKNGFRVFPFQALREDLASPQFEALLESQGSARTLSRIFADLLISQLVPQVDDLNAIIENWRPDVLVTDMAMVAPFAILHDLGKVRVAVLSHVGYCMVPGAQGPIPGRALPPRITPQARFQAWVIQTVANFMTRKVPQRIDAIRKQYGLSPTGLRITELHARAGLLLIPSFPRFDYDRDDSPAAVHYVGSLPWPTPPSACLVANVVAVEEGGYYRRNPFLLDAACSALGNSSWDVRLSVGRSRHPSSLASRPANVSIRQDSPDASVVLTTGNTESVMRALSRGIPLVVVPSLLDQSEIALRVQHFGAGELLPEKDCTPDRLREAVERVTTDPRYRAKAAEAASLIQHYNGPLEAVRLLEELARN
jgi:UDP:flavonoid glycosyltransferase YjiC (YdhE family)